MPFELAGRFFLSPLLSITPWLLLCVKLGLGLLLWDLVITYLDQGLISEMGEWGRVDNKEQPGIER